MSIQLARVNIALNRKAGAPWPETFTPYQIAYFAAWRGDEPDPNLNARAAPLENALRVACHRGELEITATTKRIPKPGPRILSAGIGRETPPHPTVEVTAFRIAAAPAARWLSAQDVPPGELLKAWFKSQGVDTEPVVIAPAPAPATEKPATLKRQALIDRHLPRWPTVDNDLKEASRNGLSAAANISHSNWDESKALAWAQSNGKLKDSDNVINLASVWPGDVIFHKMKG